jgi:hypothetical protein
VERLPSAPTKGARQSPARLTLYESRQMFQLWADAANRLRPLRNLPGRINMSDGNFTGFTF